MHVPNKERFIAELFKRLNAVNLSLANKNQKFESCRGHSGDDNGVGYLTLPSHPNKMVPGVVKKSIDLVDIVEGYKGPQVILDFDKDDVLIGIEVIA